MKEGIEQSNNFLLFLSAGVESRPFVHLELRHALSLGRKIILVHEEDERHGERSKCEAQYSFFKSGQELGVLKSAVGVLTPGY